MLHMLIMKIILGGHNDKKVMQGSLRGEIKSDINSGLKNANDIFLNISWHNKIFISKCYYFLMLNPKSVVDDTFYSHLQFTKWDNIIKVPLFAREVRHQQIKVSSPNHSQTLAVLLWVSCLRKGYE
jgi:hypothetical protein